MSRRPSDLPPGRTPQKGGPTSPPSPTRWLPWLIIGVLLVGGLFFFNFGRTSTPKADLSYSQFQKAVENGTVQSVEFDPGSGNITGTFKSTKFPDYGTVPCVTLAGKTTKCIGKAFLYLLVANASQSASVTFSGLPSATITNTGKFPGTKQCGVAGLGFDSSGIPAGWFLLPSNAKPTGNKVVFPAQTSAFKFDPGSFTVLGFTCK